MVDKFKFPVNDTTEEVDEDYYQSDEWADYDPNDAIEDEFGDSDEQYGDGWDRWHDLEDEDE